MKPCARWSVVLTPGMVLMMATSPWPPSSLFIAWAAYLPPRMLSLAMYARWTLSLAYVSTSMIGMWWALAAALIGPTMAVWLVGATSMTSGCRATTALK